MANVTVKISVKVDGDKFISEKISADVNSVEDGQRLREDAKRLVDKIANGARAKLSV